MACQNLCYIHTKNKVVYYIYLQDLGEISSGFNGKAMKYHGPSASFSSGHNIEQTNSSC